MISRPGRSRAALDREAIWPRARAAGALCALAGASLLLPAAARAPDPASAAQLAAPASGSATARVEVRFVVPALQRVDAGVAVAPLPPATTSDFIAGYAELPQSVPLLVSSNCPWELRLRATAGVLPPQSRETGPAPMVLWSLAGDRFETATVAWNPIASGPSASGVRIELRVRLALSWQQSRPGDYQPRIEYQLGPVGS